MRIFSMPEIGEKLLLFYRLNVYNFIFNRDVLEKETNRAIILRDLNYTLYYMHTMHIFYLRKEKLSIFKLFNLFHFLEKSLKITLNHLLNFVTFIIITFLYVR